MKYRYLGKSGLLLSRITLGAMTFGVKEWGCDEATSHDIIKRYLDLGGNHIDIANTYAGGRSEEIVGTFLPQINRDDVVIASKCYFPQSKNAPTPNQFGLSRKHIIAECEKSLKRLQTDYIDLYYIHGPDPITPMEETLRALDDLIRQGKVRYIGCSNVFAWQIAKARGVADRLNLEHFVAGQFLYNLIRRAAEHEIIPAAIDSGLGLMPYSPLAGGFLTGKYRDITAPEKGTRLDYRMGTDGPRFWHEQGFATAKILEEVANDCGVPMAKLAIAWTLKRRVVTSVIMGAKRVDQLEANMEPGDWDIPDDIWNTLEERTRPQDEYLTWFNRQNYQRFFDTAEFYDDSAEIP
jgi:aryl-alcohol dehydrogenase-like predicted oxidoreductase